MSCTLFRPCFTKTLKVIKSCKIGRFFLYFQNIYELNHEIAQSFLGKSNKFEKCCLLCEFSFAQLQQQVRERDTKKIPIKFQFQDPKFRTKYIQSTNQKGIDKCQFFVQ